MIKKRRFPKIFFGWWTVLAGGITDLWTAGYTAYGISAMFKPIAAELNLSRAATSVVASISRFEGGLEGPFIGWVSDRFGPKWIMLVGVFMMAFGFVLMYFINSVWGFYLVWGVLIATGHNFTCGTALGKAITDWFVKKRGVALGIRWFLTGFSGVIVLPIVAWLVATQGWRMANLIGGIVTAVIGIPLVLFFVKQHRPEHYGLLPDGATVDEEESAGTELMINKGVEYAAEVNEVEFTFRQAIKTPTFWLLIAVPSIPGFVAPVMGIHTIPFLTDIGIDPVKAAAIMSLKVAASLPTRFIGGIIADRLKANQLRFLMGAVYLLQALSIVIFLRNQTIAMIYVWFILYGLSMGLGHIVSPVMMARYFGRKAYGSIVGISAAFSTPIGMIGPIYAGWIYDTTGSYIFAFMLMAVLLAVSAVIACFIIPPKPPAQITDIRKIM